MIKASERSRNGKAEEIFDVVSEYKLGPKYGRWVQVDQVKRCSAFSVQASKKKCGSTVKPHLFWNRKGLLDDEFSNMHFITYWNLNKIDSWFQTRCFNFKT